MFIISKKGIQIDCVQIPCIQAINNNTDWSWNMQSTWKVQWKLLSYERSIVIQKTNTWTFNKLKKISISFRPIYVTFTEREQNNNSKFNNTYQDDPWTCSKHPNTVSKQSHRIRKIRNKIPSIAFPTRNSTLLALDFLSAFYVLHCRTLVQLTATSTPTPKKLLMYPGKTPPGDDDNKYNKIEF